MINVLVIDADPAIDSQIQQALPADTYHTTSARSVNAALYLMTRALPDLIILETAQINGLLFCQQLRAAPATAHLPILFLTSEQDARGVAAALDAGGDDHLRKPFAARELAARVRALLRRTASAQHKQTITLEPHMQSVFIGGKRIELTRTEYDLLELLYKHSGQHLTSSTLLQKVWSYPPGTGDTALVRNHVHNLRVKLESDPDHPRLLLSHHGRGYMLAAEAVWPAEQTMYQRR